MEKLKKSERSYNYKQKRHSDSAARGRTSGGDKRVGKKVAPTIVAVEGNKPLVISLSSLPGDLFTKKALIVPCTLENRDEI